MTTSTRPSPLNKTMIEKHLKSLKGWSVKNDKLCKTFLFDDFSSAMGFMVSAISQIEKANHHPEWQNVYNRVEVSLITHEVKGTKKPALTKLDVELAEYLNSL